MCQLALLEYPQGVRFWPSAHQASQLHSFYSTLLATQNLTFNSSEADFAQRILSYQKKNDTFLLKETSSFVPPVDSLRLDFG